VVRAREKGGRYMMMKREIEEERDVSEGEKREFN
jgi:hypothetical protein